MRVCIGQRKYGAFEIFYAFSKLIKVNYLGVGFLNLVSQLVVILKMREGV